MDSYIRQWQEVISNGAYDNTYKMAWARALVELVNSEQGQRDLMGNLEINFQEIAECFLRYYWDQTIYFELTQGPNPTKPPEVLQQVRALITTYQEAVHDSQPIWYNRVPFASLGLLPEQQRAIRSISATLGKDVSFRFMNLYGKSYPLYDLHTGNGYVRLTDSQVTSLREYREFLYEIINYRWTQILEGFNHSPRISRKVRAISEQNVRRRSLKPYQKYLDMQWEGGQRFCFHCGEPIEEASTNRAEQISIDHVIPWSFMYSDDLWNLVYCHQGENASKSNRLPKEEDITKLEIRNRQLCETMKQQGKARGKVFTELELAIQENYVRKFWIQFAG